MRGIVGLHHLAALCIILVLGETWVWWFTPALAAP